MRRALMGLKFGGLRGAREGFAPWMVRALWLPPLPEGGPTLRSATTLGWVPLGANRRKARGYDQAQELARSVGALTGWPVRSMLRRVVETSPQARRSKRDRAAALAGAFRAARRVRGRIILVDDVLTSGATAGECARVLRLSGAGEVGVLTAARALEGPLPDRCYNPRGLRPGSVVAREMPSR